MSARKKQPALEQLSRNPRPERQAVTLSGKPIIRPRRPPQEIRNDVGITQSQLADAAGVPRATIANLELGRYAPSARDGAEIYMALARLSPRQSPLYREATEEAARFIAFQEELCRKADIAIDGQAILLEKRIKENKRIKADVESKKARLAALLKKEDE